MTTTHPDIVDPGFRRHLADIVHEACELADAVERSVACERFVDSGGKTCGRPAQWIGRLACGHPHLFCNPHKMTAAAMAASTTGASGIHCAHCGACFDTPTPASFEQL